ncbi:DeoR/GlpR family DNA-binding transcription regulator [Microbacterium sp. PRC9]|uniref:DeoR/GlpR family DNA-binding transcription regulator n=1 Tax=Microbacterium sp. PRC9 TaxID=2962591 RepID=UPI002881A632|nr:DeoR/GlpR family DNA-binding transcription regulator [Microbacterium sp. PRC9]MDT0143157.1 DeoR/GlpR family DNA-binding transcription regulator [Microbacterium sp. PRC9]
MAELSAPARRARLLRMLEESGYCTTAELAVEFGVSEMTIRRDISRLEGESTVRSVRGGVVSVSAASQGGRDFAERSETSRSVKRLLAARAAADHLPGNGIIAIDAGTTTGMVATSLPAGSQLHVITHSLPVLTAIASLPEVELTVLGGTFHATSLSFSGPMTTAAISHLHVGTLFLGASGINDRGVFCGNDYDAGVKRALIEAADTVVLVCDSSKFGTTAMARVAALDALDHVIVDDAVDPSLLVSLQGRGIPVTLVPIHLISEDSQ